MPAVGLWIADRPGGAKPDLISSAQARRYVHVVHDILREVPRVLGMSLNLRLRRK